MVLRNAQSNCSFLKLSFCLLVVVCGTLLAAAASMPSLTTQTTSILTNNVYTNILTTAEVRAGGTVDQVLLHSSQSQLPAAAHDANKAKLSPKQERKLSARKSGIAAGHAVSCSVVCAHAPS